MNSKNKELSDTEIKVGDKVKVVVGNYEIKHGVVYRTAGTHVQIIDPTIYTVRDSGDDPTRISDWHPENTDWFPLSAPDCVKQIGRKTYRNLRVIHAPNLDFSKRTASVKLTEVSR